MSPRIRKTLASLAAGALVTLASTVIVPAQETDSPSKSGRHGHRHDGPRGERWQRMVEGLDLTEAQRADIQDLVAKNREEVRSLMDDLLAARKDMRAAVSAPTVDEREIRKTSERLVKAQTAMALKRARLASDIRAVLTPEQQKQLEAKRAAMRDQMRERKQRRHRHDHDSGSDDRSDDAPDESL